MTNVLLIGTPQTFRPCHGRLPRRKYMNMWPKASRSSRRLCSTTTDLRTFNRESAETPCTTESSGQKYQNINTAVNRTLPLPKCVLIDMYRAVPVKLLCSRYGMCFLVSGSMYSLARPKSMMWIICSFLFPCRPMRKFSGFTSL